MNKPAGTAACIATVPAVSLDLPSASLQLAGDLVSARRRLMLARPTPKTSGEKVEYYHDGVVRAYLDSVGPTGALGLAQATHHIPVVRQETMFEFLRHLADVVGHTSGYLLVFAKTGTHGQYDTQGEYSYDVAERQLLKPSPKRVAVWEGAKVIDHLPLSAPKGMGVIFRAVSGQIELNDGKFSRRCAKCLLASPEKLDLFLLESDASESWEKKYGPDAWRKIYGSFPFGVVSIVDSGRRGDHVLSVANPVVQAALPRLKNLFALLGADPGAFNSTQITRLGGAMRGQTGKEQAWIYRADGKRPLPSAERAAKPFLSIQDFVDRVSGLVEVQRNAIEEEIRQCNEECDRLQIRSTTAKASQPRPAKPAQGLRKLLPAHKPSASALPFQGRIADNPALCGGAGSQYRRQAAFGRVMEIRGEAIRSKQMRIGGVAPPAIIARAAEESGYTKEYVEYIYLRYPLGKKSGANKTAEWRDYDGTPFGPLAKPAPKSYLAPLNGPTRFLPHRENFGAPGSKVKLLNELGHSCMSLQITAKMTESEEIALLTEFRRLQREKHPQPLSRALTTVLKVPADYRIVQNFILPDEQVPAWSSNSLDPQIRRAAILRNLNEHYSLVTAQHNLGELMNDLRSCYPSEREFIRDLKRDAHRRRKKWPNGVPVASPSRFLPLYASLLETWGRTKQTVFRKSELLDLATRGGHVMSQPGTALRRKRRVVVNESLSKEAFNRRKTTAESKMPDRCMIMLEMLGYVKAWRRRASKRQPQGKPESRWRLCRPRKYSEKFAKNHRDTIA